MALDGLDRAMRRMAEIEQKIEQFRGPATPLPPSVYQAGPSFRGALEQIGVIQPLSNPSDIEQMIAQVSQKHGVDARLIQAVMRQESGGNPRAVSPAGAQGLMQLMPGTAASLGVTDPFNPLQNLDGGTRYLKAQLLKFGDLRHALAAYNAGPGAVQKYGGVPPFPETRNYVERILRALNSP